MNRSLVITLIELLLSEGIYTSLSTKQEHGENNGLPWKYVPLKKSVGKSLYLEEYVN